MPYLHDPEKRLARPAVWQGETRERRGADPGLPAGWKGGLVSRCGGLPHDPPLRGVGGGGVTCKPGRRRVIADKLVAYSNYESAGGGGWSELAWVSQACDRRRPDAGPTSGRRWPDAGSMPVLPGSVDAGSVLGWSRER